MNGWTVYLLSAWTMATVQFLAFYFIAREQGKTRKRILLEYFILPEHGKTAGSWLISIVGVWLIGAVVVDRVEMAGIDMSKLSSHAAITAAAGLGAELCAPKILNKLWTRWFGIDQP